MQVQDTQAPLYKLLRTTKPVRNWCLRESLVEESYWSLERCIEEASSFPTREQWQKASPVSYSKAIKRGWLTKCTTHIKDFRRKPAVPAKWNLEKCIEAGENCKSRAEFKEKFHYPYEKARLNGWLNQCCEHMV